MAITHLFSCKTTVCDRVQDLLRCWQNRVFRSIYLHSRWQ